MEFPEINMISDFEARVNCLQNPSLVSRFFSLSKVSPLYSFWKWGALILAIVATFGSLMRRIKLLFIYIRTLKPSAEPLLQYLGEDFDISDDDDDNNDDDDKCSEATDEDDVIDRQIDEDFKVAGSCFYFREQGQNRNLRRRQSPLTEFTAGKSVVKLWDSLGLGLGLDYEFDDNKSVVSMWDLDLNRDQNVTMEVKKELNGVVLTAFDTRMKSESPAIYANWDNVVGNGVRMVVGDLRNVKTPLVETDSDTWWDADAVIVEDDKFDASI